MSKEVNLYSFLRKKYPAEECVLMAEVSDTVGGRNRSLDYMVVNMWPSRGNAVIGFEVKSFRNDWIREMKNPAKQEKHFQYCDYFYLIITDEKVAKLDEIPETWGLMTVRSGCLHTLKQAPKLNPLPLTKQFVCAMLRRAAEKEDFIHVSQIEERVKQEAESSRGREAREYTELKKTHQDLLEAVRKFEDTAGIKIWDKWSWRVDPTLAGKAVQLLESGEIDGYVKTLNSLKNQAQAIVNKIEKSIKPFIKEEVVKEAAQ